jgi:hypothetical protein
MKKWKILCFIKWSRNWNFKNCWFLKKVFHNFPNNIYSKNDNVLICNLKYGRQMYWSRVGGPPESSSLNLRKTCLVLNIKQFVLKKMSKYNFNLICNCCWSHYWFSDRVGLRSTKDGISFNHQSLNFLRRNTKANCKAYKQKNEINSHQRILIPLNGSL